MTQPTIEREEFIETMFKLMLNNPDVDWSKTEYKTRDNFLKCVNNQSNYLLNTLYENNRKGE